MRVEEPMLSMVATRRKPWSRSGVSDCQVRQCPLNSSISLTSRSISAEMGMESGRAGNMEEFRPQMSVFQSNSVHLCPILANWLRFERYFAR